MPKFEKFKKIKKQWPDIRKEVLPWVGVFIGNMIITGLFFAWAEGLAFNEGLTKGPYFGVVSGTTTGFGDLSPHNQVSGAVTIYLLLSSWVISQITNSKLTEVLVKNPHLYSHEEQEREEKKSCLTLAINMFMAQNPGVALDVTTLPEYDAYNKALEACENSEKED